MKFCNFGWNPSTGSEDNTPKGSYEDANGIRTRNNIIFLIWFDDKWFAEWLSWQIIRFASLTAGQVTVLCPCAKHFIPCLVQEDPSHNWKIVELDVKNHNKQNNKSSASRAIYAHLPRQWEHHFEI